MSPSPLATMSAARCLLNQSFDQIDDLVDSGALLWVFNIGLGTSCRALRFYTAELLSPRPVRRATLDSVVGDLLPAKSRRLRGQQVADLFLCSRPHVHGLVGAGELAGLIENQTLLIEPASIAEFLRRRWLGNFRPQSAGAVSRCGDTRQPEKPGSVQRPATASLSSNHP